jgi:hypothetical protein
MSTGLTTTTDPLSAVPPERKAAVADLIALLDSWTDVSEEDAREQAETFANLARGIDESRRPYRTLFDGDRS